MYLCACVCLCVSVYGGLICLTFIFVNSFLVMITFLIPKKKSVQSIINDKVVENSFFLASQLPASVKLNNALFPDPTAKLI